MVDSRSVEEHEPVPAYLYHYTSVDTLACILQSKCIRFKPLDTMDDLQECKSSDVRSAGRHVFVSCWTDDKEESIPMWNMYARASSGVRIKMKAYPFRAEYDKLCSIVKAVQQSRGMDCDAGIPQTLIPYEKIIGEGIVAPELMDASQRQLLRRVEYVSDEELLNPSILEQNDDGVSIKLGALGVYKNKGWEFQREWRYKFTAMKTTVFSSIGDDGRMIKELSEMANDIINGDGRVPFSYYDLPLDQAAFSEMEITLGPQLSPGNRILVDAAVEKYNPSATIIESRYKGLL